jgi:indolepyruvate ferredoxin oxidoreductase
MQNKMKLGPRSRPMLVALAKAKRVRGTVADPFRWAQVRRLERAIIPEYEKAIKRVAAALTPDNIAEAVSIAALPDQVRGYEHLKLERATRYRTELAERLRTFRQRHAF